MNKKGIEAAVKNYKYYAQFPDWYWKYGLHDAKILSVCELELTPDWKERQPKRNSLEILLDSKNALCETKIQKISLYNYSIVNTKMNASELTTLDYFQNIIWLGDSIEQLNNGRYLLEIECTDLHSNLVYLTVEFETAETERE